jgi:hypothetical protein
MNKKIEDTKIEVIEEVIEAPKEVKLKDITAGRVKVSKEELRRIVRRSQTEFVSRIHIDDKYKTPGKRLRIDNDDAATRQYLESLGYVVKIDPDMKAGSGSLSQKNSMGSTIQVEQGIRLSQPGIVYEIDEDLYQARLELEAEQNSEKLQSTIESNQYEGMDKKYN